jgi:hypothetical protein
MHPSAPGVQLTSVIVAVRTISGGSFMITVFEVAGFPDTQVALEVRIQMSASLFAGTYV